MFTRRRGGPWLVGVGVVVATAVAVAVAVGALAAAYPGVGPVHAAGAGAPAVGRTLAPDTQFYVPQPDHGAIQQMADLISHNQKSDAALILNMVQTPQAVWFTSGSPKDVQQSVKQTVQQASGKGTVPVLVAYDVPGRDCSQYSAGGAATGDDYKAWIDGFADGLGDKHAVVLVEPDGLALLPTDCGQPDTYNRVSLISYAAHAMLRDPNAAVYLDAGHSAWHSTGDMAERLVQGGVLDVQGFFLNVSNFNLTTHEVKYGTWISDCIAFANDPEEGGWRLGHYSWCASQYYSPVCPVDPNDFSTWGCTDQWFSQNMGTATPTVHFVVDTSRNGQGPWTPPADHPAGDPQNWCNPPDRGLGLRPTASTGQPLVDAYLWVKIPGESDGQCYRWTTGPLDPVRNTLDPPAGQWFPAMALELVHNANPPLPAEPQH
ncbi:MAG TPA: glycoside hydrolase family 6 protein [Ktedonobacterales bacterium]|nr:glycoside hydrolase family 6 protein [Ktedonobacterales bacterium]